MERRRRDHQPPAGGLHGRQAVQLQVRGPLRARGLHQDASRLVAQAGGRPEEGRRARAEQRVAVALHHDQARGGGAGRVQVRGQRGPAQAGKRALRAHRHPLRAQKAVQPGAGLPRAHAALGGPAAVPHPARREVPRGGGDRQDRRHRHRLHAARLPQDPRRAAAAAGRVLRRQRDQQPPRHPGQRRAPGGGARRRDRAARAPLVLPPDLQGRHAEERDPPAGQFGHQPVALEPAAVEEPARGAAAAVRGAQDLDAERAGAKVPEHRRRRRSGRAEQHAPSPPPPPAGGRR